MILAIDPGNEQSAAVIYGDGPSSGMLAPNLEVLSLVRNLGASTAVEALAIEMIASYGMPVGREVFETCLWIGRFVEAWGSKPVTLVYRAQVKMHLCKSPRAKDSHIRQALIDRFGGSKEKAIGSKKTPGPLYGFKSDIWAALAVAVTYSDAARGVQ